MTTGLISVTAKDATVSAGAGAGQRLIMIGASSNPASALKRYVSTDALVAGIGDGLLTEVAAKVIAAKADQLVYSLPVSSGGSQSAVTQSGSGPAVTYAGDHTGKFAGRVKVTKAGTTDSGAARFKYALDGYTYSSDVPIAPRVAAELVGTVDMTLAGLYGPGNILDGLILPIESDTSGGVVTITFAAPLTMADMLSQINTGNGAKFIADIVAGKYLRIRSVTLGSSGVITLRGGGDAYLSLGFAEPVLVSAAEAAVLTGTVALTAGALFGGGGTLDTKTFICTSDTGGPHTTTFAAPADAAAVDTQITADAAGDYIPSINGATKLVITSATVGAAGTLLLGNGTANAAMGFVNGQAATGADAVYSDEPTSAGVDSTHLIPGSGMTLTFAAGTWVLDEVYSWATGSPGASLAAFLAAIADIPHDGSVEFSAIAIVQDWVDEHEAHTFITAIAAAVAAWQSAEPYKVVGLVVGMPMDATDAAIRAKFAAVQDAWIWAAARDCYIGGFDWLGSFRHSALTAMLIQMVTLDESQSIGEREPGAIKGVSMTGPDGTTKAGDEWTATTQMDDRFSVLCKEKGGAYFKTGRTLATSPGFNELAWTRVFGHAMQLAHDRLRNKLELTAPTDSAGRLLESVAKSIDHAVNGPLSIEILAPPGARQRASACSFRYDRENIFSQTKKLPGTLTFQVLGIAHSASIASTMVTEIA